MLYGFSGVILQGALVTLELAISSVVLAVIIGLIGAGGKLSQNRLSGLIFEGYTTLIRGVPDLVLMLLIFYGLQICLLYTSSADTMIIKRTPQAASPLASWLSYLENLHSKTIDLGLERVSQVAARLGILKPAPFVFTVAEMCIRDSAWVAAGIISGSSRSPAFGTSGIAANSS